jgi:hypothetical protein
VPAAGARGLTHALDEEPSVEHAYNGWTASPRPADFGGLQTISVAGETFAPGVRAGDVADVFQYLAEQLHARVEPVVRADWHQADDWGYSYRQNRNADNLSCHAAGCAIDYNATRHPNGKRGTFTRDQVATIRAILRDLRGCVRWGGDFTGTADEMHWEIVGSAAQVADLARAIRDERARNANPAPAVTINSAGPAPALGRPDATGSGSGYRADVGDFGPKVGALQEFLNRTFPAYSKLRVDQDFGDATAGVVREFAHRVGIASADGRNVGPQIAAKLAALGFRG